jgi:5-methyltetrahydrofolate--homocysteine methyltransferase
MTSAITSPLHEEMRKAVWAADVMMGNDEHCSAWIARHGDSPDGPQGGRRGGREGRRRAAAA